MDPWFCWVRGLELGFLIPQDLLRLTVLKAFLENSEWIFMHYEVAGVVITNCFLLPGFANHFFLYSVS